MIRTEPLAIVTLTGTTGWREVYESPPAIRTRVKEVSVFRSGSSTQPVGIGVGAGASPDGLLAWAPAAGNQSFTQYPREAAYGAGQQVLGPGDKLFVFCISTDTISVAAAGTTYSD